MYSNKIHSIDLPGIVDLKDELQYFHPSMLNNFDWSYINKQGKITTRLLKLAKKYLNDKYYKIFQDNLSVLASTCIVPPQIFNFDITQADWMDGEFGDSGSCYWGERRLARQLIRDNGGGAIRFYKKDKGYARAWIIPRGDGYIIFNGYGLSTGIIATIFSTWKQLPYKKIGLYDNNRTSGLIYINDDSSYGVNLTDAYYDLKINTDSYSQCEECDYYYTTTFSCPCGGI